jgi:phosphatidylglycerol:prolipoprotein diacylglycerol transferase
MHPTLRLGPLTLSTYTALLDMALLLSLAILMRRARRRIARPERWLAAALAALVAGVAGGRAGYVLGHLTYYRQNVDEIVDFWRGGLSWHGAVATAAIVLVLVCWLRGLRFWRLADELTVVAPLIGAAGWFGCLAVGCAYGRPAAGPAWLLADLPDLYGVWALRPNVQLLGAALSLLLLPIPIVFGRSRPAGTGAALFFALYGLGLAFLSALRGDVGPVWGGWRLDIWLNCLIAAAGAFAFGVLSIRSRET